MFVQQGFNQTGIVEQNAFQFWSIATHLEMPSQFYAFDKYTGVCDCTENQVVKADFAM